MIDVADPLLQLIHVSDLHVAAGPVPPRVDWLLRKTRRLPVLGSLIREGVAPYDTKAPRYFRSIVERFTKSWPSSTWLVDTGDLTTFGDDASLTLGFQYLRDMGADEATAVSLHGNHDAWPNDFPSEATDADLVQHRHNLRNRWFPRCWPEAPLVHRGPIEVQLYGLNSVLHCPARNSLAFGNIDQDRFWEADLAFPHPEAALDELTRLVDTHDPARDAFRILLTHHPLCFPSWKPWDTVWNRLEVARRLAPAGEPPLVHLVLSGHTHALFPRHGALPTYAGACTHTPLAEGQVQLVVGALMQDSPRAVRKPPAPPEPPHHQGEILRLFWRAEHGAVDVHRILIAKNPGEPRYRIIQPPRTGAASESVRIALR
jgi:3',5'-cyclic AMP phosphodiesterase CpdA